MCNALMSHPDALYDAMKYYRSLPNKPFSLSFSFPARPRSASDISDCSFSPCSKIYITLSDPRIFWHLLCGLYDPATFKIWLEATCFHCLNGTHLFDLYNSLRSHGTQLTIPNSLFPIAIFQHPQRSATSSGISASRTGEV